MSSAILWIDLYLAAAAIFFLFLEPRMRKLMREVEKDCHEWRTAPELAKELSLFVGTLLISVLWPASGLYFFCDWLTDPK